MVDMKKDCGKPGCPNDHCSQCSPVVARKAGTLSSGVKAGSAVPDG
jgi:hypothetical protein